ncbi:hypothetical protein CDD81_4633 [Ophiocordyceps australis]|uniref:Uncharacterized protein n=1 Tax=Ophiocordyceps australis TaxID=1399860 RepID=A0A2C5YAX6_9HYPO|nr:hypothetical protein CDD81_4633 [Ophiocordyceps australis]
MASLAFAIFACGRSLYISHKDKLCLRRRPKKAKKRRPSERQPGWISESDMRGGQLWTGQNRRLSDESTLAGDDFDGDLVMWMGEGQGGRGGGHDGGHQREHERRRAAAVT